MDYQELQRKMKEQKEEMKAGERIKAYNEGKEVDFLPFNLQAPDFAMANIFGYTTMQYNTDYEVKKEVVRRMNEEFGIDTLPVGLGLRTLGGALGSKLDFPENGIDTLRQHILLDYKDFERYEIVDPRKNSVLSSILETAKRLREDFPEIKITTRVAGPITTAIAIRPIEMVLKDTRKDPENLHRLLDYVVECSLKWFEVYKAELGPTGTGFSDPVTCMDVISKKQFDEFSLPYIARLIEGTYKIMGSRPSAHICGRTGDIWSDLADAGLFSFSVDNCEDLEEIKRVAGDRMQIAGNVPPVDVMLYGTIDDVIQSSIQCIRKGADSPSGFILATGCQVPVGTPRQNVEAFIYAARKYGRNAQKGRLPKGLEEA